MEFDLPWRVHWSLTGPAGEGLVRRVRECQPLVLVVEVDVPADLAPLGLPWPNTSVVAVHRQWLAADPPVASEGVERWELPVAGPGEARIAVSRALDLPVSGMSLRWVPGRGRLFHLRELMEIALVAGCGLTLPNSPADGITAPGGRGLPSPAEVDRLDAGELAGLARRLGPDRLRVHDFILTRVMGLTGSEPQGCEAANALAFIDGDGKVYPCSSLLVEMGDLHRDTMETIWQNPMRERLRRDIRALPAPCLDCDHLDRCLGGCRGIVYHLKGHFGAVDPLCAVAGDQQHG